MKRSVVATSLLLAAVTATSALANEELAHKLVRLRSEVESLSEELELMRATEREQLAGLAQRRAELDSERQREELRRRRVEQNLEEHAARLASAAEDDAALKPAVLSAAGALRAHVAGGLPFQTSERLAAIDDLVGATDRNELPASKAVVRLWSLMQDERRLTGESGLYRQPIVVDGGEVLADVARVGMVMMFFATPDGRFGRAVRAGDSWRFELVAEHDGGRDIASFFDAFRKRVRGGYFELPASIPAEVSQ